VNFLAVIAGPLGALAAVDDAGALVLLESLPVVGVGSRNVLDVQKLTKLIRDSASDVPLPRGRPSSRVSKPFVPIHAVVDTRDGAARAKSRVDGVAESFASAGTPFSYAANSWRSDLGCQADAGLTLKKARLAAPHGHFEGSNAIARARAVLLARLSWRTHRIQDAEKEAARLIFPAASGMKLNAMDGSAGPITSEGSQLCLET
jgi:hypothetical protein